LYRDHFIVHGFKKMFEHSNTLRLLLDKCETKFYKKMESVRVLNHTHAISRAMTIATKNNLCNANYQEKCYVVKHFWKAHVYAWSDTDDGTIILHQLITCCVTMFSAYQPWVSGDDVYITCTKACRVMYKILHFYDCNRYLRKQENMLTNKSSFRNHLVYQGTEP